jgi:alpha-galactosidase
MDYAQLAVAQLQSTSDQQDPLRYPPITAAAATAATPEQAAVWAYPQPDQTFDEIAFTLTGPLLGRIHLSGFINLMNDEQFELVRSAVSVYKEVRGEIGTAHPFWPLGLPGWEDGWLAHGLRGADATYVIVWRRESGDGTERTFTVPHLLGAPARPTVLYPATSDAGAQWDAAEGQLTVSLPRANTAVLVRLNAG